MLKSLFLKRYPRSRGYYIPNGSPLRLLAVSVFCSLYQNRKGPDNYSLTTGDVETETWGSLLSCYAQYWIF